MLDIQRPQGNRDMRTVAALPIVIKLGGSVLSQATGEAHARREEETCAPVWRGYEEIATLWRGGHRIVLVHGGGPAIDRWLQRLHITPQFINGRRVTDSLTLEVVQTVLIGQINSEIVRQLTASGVNAVGLSGFDGGMLRARRAPAALGLVGIDVQAQRHLLDALWIAGSLPVVAPLSLGPAGEGLNVNADEAATAIASTLHAGNLIFLSDVAGVRDAAGNIIAHLTHDVARTLIASGTIANGMVPKVEACLDVLTHVQAVSIVDGTQPHAIRDALDPQGHAGTCIVPG